MNDKNLNSNKGNKRNNISESKVHQMRSNLNSQVNKSSAKNKVSRENFSDTSIKRNSSVSKNNSPNLKPQRKSTHSSNSNDREVFDFEKEINKPLQSDRKKQAKGSFTQSKKLSNGGQKYSDKYSHPAERKSSTRKTSSQPNAYPKNIVHINSSSMQERSDVPKGNSSKSTMPKGNKKSKNSANFAGKKQQFSKNNFRKTQRNTDFSAYSKLRSNSGSNANNGESKIYTKVFLILLCFALLSAVGYWSYKKFFVSETQVATKKVAVKKTTKSTPKVPDCDNRDLNLNVFVKENQVLVGKGTDFGITVTNKSSKTCLAKAGSKKFGIRVMSGDQKIWDSTSCPVTSEENPLLLKPGQTWTGTINWDGINYNAKCEKLSISQAGTYRLLGVKDGDLLDVSYPFVLKNG